MNDKVLCIGGLADGEWTHLPERNLPGKTIARKINGEYAYSDYEIETLRAGRANEVKVLVEVSVGVKEPSK